MASFPKKIGELCTPALVYFVISVIALLISILQNLGNNKKYSLGNFSCRVPSTIMVFILKVIYILFWTWVLNLICKSGHKEISWFLVLLPFILLFVIMGVMMMKN
jgi:hypothetical protein